MRTSSLLFLVGSLASVASAVTRTSPRAATPSPDGVIVPFTSVLPVCASLCGPLFDAQGGCIPSLTDDPQTCFCKNSATAPFLEAGTTAARAACGPLSCQDAADLQEINNWVTSYCNGKSTTTPTTTTTAGTAGATSTSTSTKASAPANKTWIAGHYGWVIFVVVVTLAIIGGWVSASYFRRRYLQRKEREFELRPPVSVGPHQMQAMTGGFNSEVALGSGRGESPMASETKPLGGDAITSQAGGGQRGSRGWLRKDRV